MGGDSGSDDDGGGDSAYTTRPGEEGWGDPDPDSRTETNPFGTFDQTISGGNNPVSADVGRTYKYAMSTIGTKMGEGTSDQTIENYNRMSAAREEADLTGGNVEGRFENVIPGIGTGEFQTDDKQNTFGGYQSVPESVVPGSFLDFSNPKVSLLGLAASGAASILGAPFVVGKGLGIVASNVAKNLGINPTLSFTEDGVSLENNTGASGPVAQPIIENDPAFDTRDDERGDPNMGTSPISMSGLMGGIDPDIPRNEDGSIKRQELTPAVIESKKIALPEDNRRIQENLAPNLKVPNPPDINLGDNVVEPTLIRPIAGASGRGAVDPRSTMPQNNVSLEDELEEEAIVSQRNFRRGNNSLFSNGRGGYYS